MKVDEAAKRAWAEIKRRIVGYCELAKIEMPEMSDEIGAEIITAEYAKEGVGSKEVTNAANLLDAQIEVTCAVLRKYHMHGAANDLYAEWGMFQKVIRKALSSLPKEGQ